MEPLEVVSFLHVKFNNLTSTVKKEIDVKRNGKEPSLPLTNQLK